MKVLDLFCAQGHAFEGWFASEEDFQSQHACGLVQCPMCGDAGIRKGLSAPRLNLRTSGAASSANESISAPQASGEEESKKTAVPQAMQAAWLHVARQIMSRTEDVGGRFASEARRMHYGEIEERGIRGQATPQETAELLDEGIAVLPLLLPVAAKEPLQ